MLKINFYQWWIMHWYYLGKSHILLNCFGVRIKGKTERNGKTEKKMKMAVGDRALAPYPTPAQPTSYLPLVSLPCSDPGGRYRCSTRLVAV
jgi:hypothetical protein